MKSGPDIAHLAALIGDPARANMLTALMAGQALTATELAREAGVTPQTASSHLAKLADGGLLRRRSQGRHRYFALADDDVAALLETLMGLAARTGHLRSRPGPRDTALRQARTCYNHLAGEAGTALYRALRARGVIAGPVGAPHLTPAGEAFMTDFGIALDPLKRARAPLCLECLDWSERRPHLAGSLGRAMLRRIEDLGWVRRDGHSRIVAFTPTGQTAFARLIRA